MGLTRARKQTHLYADREALCGDSEGNDLQRLAQQIRSDEREIASIEFPVTHARERELRDTGLLEYASFSKSTSDQTNRRERETPGWAM